MLRTRFLWAILAAVLGLMQAWDSGAFEAGRTVGAIAVAAVSIPAAAIALTSSAVARFSALGVAIVLLTWARINAPITLNTLHLALFAPAIYMLGVSRWVESEAANRQAG